MDEHEKELRELWNFMKDFWQVIKKYYACESQPNEFWGRLGDDLSAISRKYGFYKPESRTTDRRKLIMKNLVNAFLDAQEGRDWLERHGTLRRDRE